MAQEKQRKQLHMAPDSNKNWAKSGLVFSNNLW